MDLELDVLNEAHAALIKADMLNPGLPGPIDGLGLYGPLAAAVRRLAEWLRAEAAHAPQEKEGRGHCTILHGPQVAIHPVEDPFLADIDCCGPAKPPRAGCRQSHACRGYPDHLQLCSSGSRVDVVHLYWGQQWATQEGAPPVIPTPQLLPRRF